MEQALTWFFYFVVYSFLGWVCETCFCSVAARRFINRGFLNGPFCPIYGTGAVLVLLLFTRYRDDLLALGVLSTVVTSIVEYVTSYLLEKLFHLQLWDYSARWANLNGRVCLRNSLLFGVMSVLMVRVIHPHVEAFFALWPPAALAAACGVLIAYFLADVAVTVMSVLQINRKAHTRQLQLEALAAARESYKKAKAKAKAAGAAVPKLHRLHRRIVAAFPNMKSARYAQALEEMKRELAAYREKRKRK